MQIVIQTLTGKKILMNFEADDTFLRVKQCLQEKEGVPVEQMRLIFGGKQIADEGCFGDYNIQAGAKIHMVIQLRGGL